MKKLASIGSILTFGIFLIAINIGGTAGCGSSGGGGGTLTEQEEEEAATDIMSSLISSASSAGEGSGALVVGSNLTALKSQVTGCTGDASSFSCTCEGGGTMVGTVSGSTISVTFNNCDLGDATASGTISMTVSGDTITGQYDDFEITTTCGTFTANGTVTISGNTITLNITATGEGTTFTITGSLTADEAGALTGTLDISNSMDISCTFNDTNVECCADLVAACTGLTLDDLCEGCTYLDVCL